MLAGLLIVLALSGRYIFDVFAQGLKWNDSFAVYLYTWNHYVSVGLAVVVLTLPHGLPLTFLLSLNKVIKTFNRE